MDLELPLQQAVLVNSQAQHHLVEVALASSSNNRPAQRHSAEVEEVLGSRLLDQAPLPLQRLAGVALVGLKPVDLDKGGQCSKVEEHVA